jgi:hypothetical protein
VAGGPLADPVAETRRVIALAGQQGLVLRALGGVGVLLQAPDAQPRLPRRVKDIDLAAVQGTSKATAALLGQAGYHGEEMFNALRGSRRLLFHDLANSRHLDVFVGEFAMCHTIPLTARLDRDELTVPREELLLTKLQIVELTGNTRATSTTCCSTTTSGTGRGPRSRPPSSPRCAPATGGCGAPAS